MGFRSASDGWKFVRKADTAAPDARIGTGDGLHRPKPVESAKVLALLVQPVEILRERTPAGRLGKSRC